MKKIYSTLFALAVFSGSAAAGVQATNVLDDAWTFQRNYSDGSSRYYNSISATVDGTETVLYSVEDAKTEPYYVKPVQGQWLEEGAFIDFTDKVIVVPAGTESFKVTLKSNGSGTTSTKWSQNAIYVDWNKNYQYTDEGETNGVLDVAIKPNEEAKVVSAAGISDTISVPSTVEPGTYSMLICLMEPKDLNNGSDRWADHWDWSSDIFFDEGVCRLYNGQAYELTVKIEGAAAIGEIATDENAPVEYFNLQGMSVSADNLTPGVYVCRQGKKVTKVLVK